MYWGYVILLYCTEGTGGIINGFSNLHNRRRKKKNFPLTESRLSAWSNLILKTAMLSDDLSAFLSSDGLLLRFVAPGLWNTVLVSTDRLFLCWYAATTTVDFTDGLLNTAACTWRLLQSLSVVARIPAKTRSWSTAAHPPILDARAGKKAVTML